MAKSKRAAALFEVIHASREKPNPLFNSARSPRKSFVTSWARSLFKRPSTIEQPQHSIPESPAPDLGGVDVNLDSRRQLITFKFSYHSAAIVAFALIVTLTLAYLVGRKMSRSPVLAIATQTTEQLRAKPAHPDVLNITAKSAPAPAASIVEPDNGTSSRGTEITTEKTDAPASSARSVNLNYVVVQSYPDEKSADDARDALLKAGVGRTVEQKLRGLNPTWFTVVGTQGFARISSQDYKDYVTKLEQISQQFAQSKHSFRAFQPMAYKWDRAASETASLGQ